MGHRVGILGLGVMGERMLRNMTSHPAFEVVAAWDPADAARERLRRVRPETRLAEAADRLVAAPDIDCVYIASPPASHLHYAGLAFDHGKRVFCEKPLSTDLAAARAAVERVETEGHAAAINFPFCSAPAVRAIASGLKSGELGPVTGIDIEVAFAVWPRDWQRAARWLAERREGGFMREVVSHFLFLTQRLIGPLGIRESRIDYPPDGHSTETAIVAALAAGAVPVALRGRVGGDIADLNRWTVTGPHGAFMLHDWYSLKRRIDSLWLDVDFGDGSMRQRSYMAQLDSLDAMLAGRPHPLATFREGLAVQQTVEALLASG